MREQRDAGVNVSSEREGPRRRHIGAGILGVLVPFVVTAASTGCLDGSDETTESSAQAIAGFYDRCEAACEDVIDLVLEERSCDEATRKAAQQACYDFCEAKNKVVSTLEEAEAAIEEAVKALKEATNLEFTASVTSALAACDTTVQYVSAPTISATTGAAIVTVGLLVGGVAVIAACTAGTAATGGILGFVCAPVTLQVGGAVAATVLLSVNMGETANACSAADVQGHTSCEPPLEPRCDDATDNASCVQCVTQFEAEQCLPTTNGTLWSAPYWDDAGYCNTGWAGCDYL